MNANVIKLATVHNKKIVFVTFTYNGLATFDWQEIYGDCERGKGPRLVFAATSQILAEYHLADRIAPIDMLMVGLIS